MYECTTEEWYEYMRCALLDLEYYGKHYGCVLCAGDVFDVHNPPLELVNFALQWMPKMYAVPGQHDLPYHRNEDRHRTAYEVLVNASRITDLVGVPVKVNNGLFATGFPWGSQLSQCPPRGEIQGSDRRPKLKDVTTIAVCHRYVWSRAANKHPKAEDTDKVSKLDTLLRGYDVRHFGDNHISFDAKTKTGLVFNGGGFLPRTTADNRTQSPIGLLDWSPSHGAEIHRVRLSAQHPPLATQREPEAERDETRAAIAEFAEGLQEQVTDAANFLQIIGDYANENVLDEELRNTLLEIAEGVDDERR